MLIVFTLIGLICGAVAAGFAGALAGAAAGFAIASHLASKNRLEELERAVERLEWERTSVREMAEPAPPAARAPLPSGYARTREPQPRRDVAPAAAPPATAELSAPPHPATPAADEARAQTPLFEDVATAARVRHKISREPDFDIPLLTWVRDYFTSGNVVVRVGIIMLFIGVAFLLKFASDRNLMPIELRVAGVALGGVALLVIGWRLRERQRAYALALQGGGVGLLYLCTFAALRLYDLLPPTAAFAMLVGVAALSAYLAIGQNSLALAALGATGGFLAPVLASTGQGNHVVLFSYYALLDAGIVAIAWFKAWRPLNLLAFVFTFAIGTAWGVLRYSPEHFATTEPFLALYFVMFVTVAVLFALRRAPRLTDYVDGTLVFGTPVVTMLLQAALVHDRPYALAFSSLVLSAAYLLLATAIWRRGREELRLLAESFLALGVAFLTLAVPLALDGHWTAATWALEGAAILWVGLRQERRLAVAAGVLLQAIAALAYLARHDVAEYSMPLANSGYLGALFIALGGFVSARLMSSHALAERYRSSAELPLYWALAWWLYAGGAEIVRFMPTEHVVPALLGFAAVTAIGCAALSRWDDWRAMRPLTILLLPALALAGVAGAFDGHLLEGSGALAWPAAVGAWIWLLRWRERGHDHGHDRGGLDAALHVATVWLLVACVSFELAWQVEHARLESPAWHRVMWALPAAAALALIVACARRPRWPVSVFPDAYVGRAAAGLAAYLWLWSIVANASDASARPLPYLPIANPVELAQAFALAAVLGWLLHLRRDGPEGWRSGDVADTAWPALAAAVFACLTAMLLRALHHYAGIPYEVEDLARSTLVQSALSIFWGGIALGAMVAGARLRLRIVWFTGAALLGVVLVKMFLVDLSQTGTVARIVSFIGVGVLMLIIGRFAPVPPAVADDPATPETGKEAA